MLTVLQKHLIAVTAHLPMLDIRKVASITFAKQPLDRPDSVSDRVSIYMGTCHHVSSILRCKSSCLQVNVTMQAHLKRL